MYNIRRFFISYKIQIIIDTLILNAELNDTPTAIAIRDVLPITSDKIEIYGKSIYFEIPVSMKLDKGNKVEVEIGDLAYLPIGIAPPLGHFCIFWGETPASFGNKPAPLSSVNPIGKVLDDINVLDKFTGYKKITIKLATERDIDKVKNLKKLVELGESYYNDNNFSEAIECYEKALRKDHNFVEALFKIACCYAQKNDIENEMRYYVMVLEKNAKHQEASKNLKKVINKFKLDPNDARGNNIIGYCYEMIGEFFNAIEYYQKVLAIEPEHKSANKNLKIVFVKIADSYAQKEDWEKIIEYCQKALEINPEYKEAMKKLDNAYIKSGNPDKAKERQKKRESIQSIILNFVNEESKLGKPGYCQFEDLYIVKKVKNADESETIYFKYIFDHDGFSMYPKLSEFEGNVTIETNGKAIKKRLNKVYGYYD